MISDIVIIFILNSGTDISGMDIFPVLRTPFHLL